jgi:putative NADPH-quinone reductase
LRAPADAPDILKAQSDIAWADELVLVFPLWIGSAPALARAFLEQVSRGGYFAETSAKVFKPKLKGKAARFLVTMGMPGWFYRLHFGARGLKSLADSLRICGVAPVRMALFGAIESPRAPREALARARALGARL